MAVKNIKLSLAREDLSAITQMLTTASFDMFDDEWNRAILQGVINDVFKKLLGKLIDDPLKEQHNFSLKQHEAAALCKVIILDGRQLGEYEQTSFRELIRTVHEKIV